MKSTQINFAVSAAEKQRIAVAMHTRMPASIAERVKIMEA
jgi:hypothetical protein